MNDKIEILPAGINTLTDDIVQRVHDSKRMFPSVVIELANRQFSLDPRQDRIELMTGIRDELVDRLGQYMLSGSEMVE